ILYSAVLVFVAAIMLFALSNRSTLDVSVLADRNPLFVQLSDGSVRNGYQVKIVNKEHSERIYRVSIDGLDGAILTRPALAGEGTDTVTVGADKLENLRFFVSLPGDDVKALDGGEAGFGFVITDLENGKTATRKTTFRGPGQ
ncbi:MAG: FixG Ig-like domain-containing protein, partial [Nitratireductor sp.]